MKRKFFKIFYKASIVKNPPPQNYKEEDLPLFKTNFEIQLPDSGLQILNRVFVTDLGIIYKNFSSVKDNIVCYAIDFKNYRFRYLLKSFLTFKKRIYRGEKCVIVFDNYSGPNGFAHWICDGLTRLAELSETIHEYTLIVPAYFKNQGVYAESLKLFNITSIHYLPKNSITYFKTLHFPSPIGDTGNFHPENVNKLRKLAESKLELSSSSPKNIYISRAKANRRFVENEQEVTELLANYGFEIIFLEDHPFPDQVKIVSNANNIVSIHGAALAMLLFAKENSRVLELRNVADATNNMYYLLANVCQLRYYYLNCRGIEKSKNANNFNLEVDVRELEATLQYMNLEKSK